jgi:hypothetical protein
MQPCVTRILDGRDCLVQHNCHRVCEVAEHQHMIQRSWQALPEKSQEGVYAMTPHSSRHSIL